MNIHDVSLTFDLCHSESKSFFIHHVLDTVLDILLFINEYKPLYKTKNIAHKYIS